MINRTVLVGRLVKDPELRYSAQGVGVCNFTIAVNRNFKSNDGKDADFINAVVFKGGAESLANYQRKGNLIGIEGRLQSRSYQDKDDRTVYVTEVVCDSVQFLEPKNSNQQNQQSSKNNQTPPPKDSEPADISDSDLPF